MNIDGYSFMLDSATKFYRSLRVSGWFHHPQDQLARVEVHDVASINQVAHVGLEHGGVASLGKNKGFDIQILRAIEEISLEINIAFKTTSGRLLQASLGDLCLERLQNQSTALLSQNFQNRLQSDWHLLEVGGRNRSPNKKAPIFKGPRTTILDIAPGNNVDVVGDAHALATYFAPDTFDAFASTSVFEHLLTPWAVAIQLNKVLKLGGIGYIHTHQTLGMHDMPWDFWRFSDTAWDAIFNQYTGFEIIGRAMDSEQFVIPMIYKPSKHDAERSVGFEGSAVMVRKTGPSRMVWNLTPADLITTAYPMKNDNNKADPWD